MYDDRRVQRRDGIRARQARIVTRLLVSAPLLLGLGACSTMNVHSELIQPGPISQNGTYAWGQGTLPGDDYPALQGDFVEQTIHDAVDAALGGHGFNLVPATDADVLVDFHMVASEQYETITSYHEETRTEQQREYTYTQGALVIDILRASDDALLWRATAFGVVERQEPDWIRNRIREAVTKMFADFPGRDVF